MLGHAKKTTDKLLACLSPRLFVHSCKCCFVVFHPQQAHRERAMARVFPPIAGEVPLDGALGGWPVGSPGASPTPRRAGGRFQRFSEAVRPPTVPPPLITSDPPCRRYSGESAARGVRLEGPRDVTWLHRARILRAAVAPLVEGEAGLRRGSDGLRAALVEGCRRPRRYPGSRWPSGPSACASSAASCRPGWRGFQGWRGLHPG